jgi:HEAT repeat protein
MTSYCQFKIRLTNCLTAAVVVATSFATATSHGQDVQFNGELDLPKIVRFRELPMRMMLEVTQEPGKTNVVLEPGHLEYFDNLIRTSTDPELQTEAANSLARIARGDHGDISGSIDGLEKLLTSENRNVRRAAAMALIEGKATSASPSLLELSQTGNDRLRQLIDPALAAWSFAPAGEVWQARLTDINTSGTSLALAARGIEALKFTAATDAVRLLVSNPNASFQSRQAAARTLCSIAPAAAREVAAKLEAGTMRERLLAIRLLSSKDAGSPEKLLALCEDTENAIAALAWTQLQELKPELLRSQVENGHAHADAGVRMAAIQVMSNFPDAKHCGLLQTLTGDVHIGVRNQAREVLVAYAKAKTELRDLVVSNATLAVQSNDTWQQTEQALHIAAALKEAKFTKLSVPLLTADRAEVYVTAAWLMHLFPDPLVMKQVTTIAEQRYPRAKEPIAGGDISNQLAHLFLSAGYLEHKPMQTLCEKQLNKGSIAGIKARAAAVWALGMMNRGEAESPLVRQLIGRLNDRSTDPPELPVVRRMAIMSIARMGAKSEIDQIRRAYKIDPPQTLIPEAARWALQELGETDIPPAKPPRDVTNPVGGWTVSPLAPRK